MLNRQASVPEVSFRTILSPTSSDTGLDVRAKVSADFIKQLLRHCNRWPEPESVLVMDNATIHCSKEIEEMCERAGVKQVFTAPYTPITNPIEEHFAELKAYAKVRWDEHIDLIHKGLGVSRAPIDTRQLDASLCIRRQDLIPLLPLERSCLPRSDAFWGPSLAS